MIYLIALIFTIALSVWLWGQGAVKKAIKIILGLLLLGIVLLIAVNVIESNQKKQNEKVKEKVRSECFEKAQSKYDARPICPKSITSFDASEKNQCKIDWNLQNDPSKKEEWEISKLFLSTECLNN